MFVNSELHFRVSGCQKMKNNAYRCFDTMQRLDEGGGERCKQADRRHDCWAASRCGDQSFHITEVVTHKQDSFYNFIIRNSAKQSPACAVNLSATNTKYESNTIT